MTIQGVCGTGKSTLGNAVADALGLPFIDGDDLHPASNVAKMSAGTPLNDEDRMPWLATVRKAGETEVAKGSGGAVLACSSLKKSYRQVLRGLSESTAENTTDEQLPTCFLWIKGSRELLLDRMAKRQGHFMKVSMLDSQLATLEDPEEESDVVVVPAENSTPEQLKISLEGVKRLTSSRE